MLAKELSHMCVAESSGKESEALETIEPEPQEGNVEYKLQLCEPTPERLVHLVTQMNWRLDEGQVNLV